MFTENCPHAEVTYVKTVTGAGILTSILPVRKRTVGQVPSLSLAGPSATSEGPRCRSRRHLH